MLSVAAKAVEEVRWIRQFDTRLDRYCRMPRNFRQFDILLDRNCRISEEHSTIWPRSQKKARMHQASSLFLQLSTCLSEWHRLVSKMKQAIDRSCFFTGERAPSKLCLFHDRH